MTNSEALGYATIALNNILSNRIRSFKERKKLIQELSDEMHYLFDIKIEKEAEEIGSIIIYAETERELKKKLKEYNSK